MENQEIERLYDRAGLKKALQLSRTDIALRLEKAVHDGKLDPKMLGWFNTSPLQALRMIPEDIAKSYGLPCGPTGEVSSREETELALEKAVQDGKLDPRVLGAFRTQPQRVLESIPEAVAKSYRIPRPAKRETPKVPAYYAPWWEWAEYNRAMNRNHHPALGPVPVPLEEQWTSKQKSRRVMKYCSPPSLRRGPSSGVQSRSSYSTSPRPRPSARRPERWRRVGIGNPRLFSFLSISW